MFLSLRNLSKQFAGRDSSGEVIAVDNVNVQIERGEFVTLLGPSGCGKTTTLRLIAGFEFPTSGEIVLDGQVINEAPPNRRNMAMVFQSYAIFPHLNVFENIAYGLRIKKLSNVEVKRQVGQVLDLTELTGLENRAPNQLSGGQQQRVALARALVNDPRLLVLDEPLGKLDSLTRLAMQTELVQLWQRAGFSALLVTHDVEEALFMAQRVVVFTERPARVREVLVNDLPYPRHRGDARLAELRRRALALLGLGDSW